MQIILNRERVKNYSYYLLVVYYLILNYFPSNEIDKYSPKYFLFVLPVLGFIGSFSPYLITRWYNNKSLILLTLLGSTILVSLIRLDISTIFSIFLFSATLIVIFNSGITPSIKFINVLFVLSIIGSIISFHVGPSDFGYIPNFNKPQDLVSGGVGWRISLFPLVTESGFFALLVIIGNYFLNPNRSRFLFYTLGLYFLVFSASRTSLVIFLFFFMFIYIKRLFVFKERTLYSILNPLFITFFILFLTFKSLLFLAKDTRIGFLNEFLFRSEKGMQQEANLQDVATRNWIWEQHLSIYSQNPVFGVGTYDFNDYKDKITKSYQRSSGSESFITALIARIGLLAFLIIYLLFLFQRTSMKNKNPFVYMITIYIFIAMISYGSFMVAYNFMFLLLFGMINNKTHRNTN